MDVALWVVAVALALVFGGVGATKLITSREEMAANGMEYVEDLTDAQVKGIGVVELLGAVGVVLPPLVGVLPVLAPTAAAGLAIVMVLAVATHVRRGEVEARLTINVALFAMAAFVAWGRFGPHPF